MRLRQSYVDIKVRNNYSEKYIESESLQIQSKHWGGEHHVSMEGIFL